MMMLFVAALKYSSQVDLMQFTDSRQQDEEILRIYFFGKESLNEVGERNEVESFSKAGDDNI